MRLAALAGGIALLALAGCGESDEDEVSDTITSYASAAVEGDGAAACGLLTEEAQEMLAEGSRPLLEQQDEEATCESAIELLGMNLAIPDEGEPEVSDVAVDGDTATATVQGESGPPTEVSLVKSGDEWLLESGMTAG